MLFVLTGCGDDQDGPPPDVVDADRGRIADVINETRDAVVSGEFGTVCDNLINDGEFMIGALGDDFPDEDSCVDVLDAAFADSTEAERRKFAGEGPYRPAYVDVTPADDPGFNDSTDTVPEGGPREVQVPCLEGDGNAWFAEHQSDGSWELAVPFCSGR